MIRSGRISSTLIAVCGVFGPGSLTAVHAVHGANVVDLCGTVPLNEKQGGVVIEYSIVMLDDRPSEVTHDLLCGELVRRRLPDEVDQAG
jgi:hypothetical protein